jgi:glycosyltransferase involved in cell wall biosynthesis
MKDSPAQLLVDIQTVQGGFFGNRGIRRYAVGLARALVNCGIARALLLNPGRPWLEEFPRGLRTDRRVVWATRSSLRALDGDGPVAYVMTSPFERTDPAESAVPSYVVESGMPVICVLYDLIPEIVDVYPPSLMSAYRARRQFVREADLLFTLSDHVRRDAIARLDFPAERVAVIGADASAYFRSALPGERPEQLLAAHLGRITRPFVLSVTGWLAHKNAEGLIEAWSRLPSPLRREYQLVLTCPLPPGGARAWNDVAAGHGLASDDVVVTDRVDDAVVRALYQRAELLVLPSLEEGFGLPVLEAARCGCPSITSNTSSLPEVLAWEPSTFPPLDIDTMSATIERALVDPVFRSDLRAAAAAAARRHTWERVGERTMQACASMSAPRRSRRRPPLRVALVGRLRPPSGSSAATIDRVTDLLGAHGRVDRFDISCTDGAVTADPKTAPDVRSYPVSALGRARDPFGYDAICYVVDAHPSNHVRELARAFPGVVWFVEPPDDHAVGAELAQRASRVVRAPSVAAFAVDPGPFGRIAPTSVVPSDGPSDLRALLEALGVAALPVRQPAR